MRLLSKALQKEKAAVEPQIATRNLSGYVSGGFPSLAQVRTTRI